MIHINYPNDRNRIYCRKEHKVVTLDTDGKFWDKCSKCNLFAGDYQGMGVECNWNDPDNEGNTNVYVDEPNQELIRVSKMIDLGQISKKV